jgi:hypothetical protein
VLTEIIIERDASCCLWKPNVHDGIIDSITIKEKDTFSISFLKCKDRFYIKVSKLYYYGIKEFHNSSGITEIFIGSFEELSNVFSEQQHPWIVANPSGLSDSYLRKRKEEIEKSAVIVFIIGDEGGYISIVGESVSAWCE